MCTRMCSISQWCPTLCDPMECSLQGSSALGIFQARILECVAISYSRGHSWPGIKPLSHVSCIGRCILTSGPSEKPDITAILDISYKGNDTICILLSLTSFTLHYVFKIHPCRSAYQYLNPFYCPVTIPSMNISHFSLFSSVDGDIWIVSTFWLLCIFLLWISIILWICFYLSCVNV